VFNGAEQPGRGETGAPVRFALAREMILKFLFQFAIERSTSKEGTQAQPKDVHPPVHGIRPPAASRSQVIAPARRCQFVASRSRCLQPARVSE
jgi:hypothetical protein